MTGQGPLLASPQWIFPNLEQRYVIFRSLPPRKNEIAGIKYVHIGQIQLPKNFTSFFQWILKAIWFLNQLLIGHLLSFAGFCLHFATASEFLGIQCLCFLKTMYETDFMQDKWSSENNCIFFQNCSDLLWKKELANILRSLEQFMRTVKVQYSFWSRMFFNLFLEVSQI